MQFPKGCGIIYKQSGDSTKQVGVDYDEGPPVPISNTEVKLVHAEDTWLVTALENRFSPTLKTISKEVVFFLCYEILELIYIENRERVFSRKEYEKKRIKEFYKW